MGRVSDGHLVYERASKRLTFWATPELSYSAVLTETELRNWLQVVLLSSWQPDEVGEPHERAILELLAQCRGQHASGARPFDGMRVGGGRTARDVETEVRTWSEAPAATATAATVGAGAPSDPYADVIDPWGPDGAVAPDLRMVPGGHRRMP
ncbi:hypothetical protein [Nocardioides sp. GY 10127]|uniref:hypothetical protein n=1 Tax=Nocardioides sp. GY 10127 TaxID=2569762 RepID=UPI0010A7B1E9|nr:hypothetical protein [Nocardioides sp. GY 10127]TIC82708.1 hypothetical protein E8D37_08415 [Nocardioides sp. GY 10127]